MVCPTGKTQHKTPDAAQRHADALFQKFGYRPNIYSCQECGDLHVGGGYETQPMSQANVPSSADRLARFVPISVAQRIYKERIKVAAGKILTLEDLILEQLVKTFKTDLQIARDLHCSVHTVHKIRHAVDEVNGYQRARRFLVNLLRVDPKRSRIELAKMIAPISYKLLENVVKEMGLSGAAAGNSRRGKFHTKDRRNALAAANKIHQADSEYRKNLSEKSKALWQDPEYRKNMNKSRERRTREFKALWQKPEFHKSLTEQAKARWQDPEYRKKATAWLDNNPELRKSLSEKRKALWQDPEYRKKVLAAQERHRLARKS